MAYFVATVAATVPKAWHGHANNLKIFRASFWNLLAGQNLYALHPGQHADYFKYSPTFALFFAPFALLPESVSAVAWNLGNVFALFVAIELTSLSRRDKAVVFALIFIELLTSVQNFQSNPLVTALLVFTLVAFERGWPAVAGLCVALGATIKIFGAAGAILFLFYPGKIRFLLSTAICLVLLALAPLAVTSFGQLQWQYRNWSELLRADYLAKEKLSVMNWLRAWFGVNWPNVFVQLSGLAFFLLPLIRVRRYHDLLFRRVYLASLLLFLVLFNHKAESPMFILAVTGVALWAVSVEPNWWVKIVVGLVLLITSLGSTDLVPRSLRENLFTPLALKTVPCLLAWIAIQAWLWQSNPTVTARRE